jgi:hypothetical protein
LLSEAVVALTVLAQQVVERHLLSTRVLFVEVAVVRLEEP